MKDWEPGKPERKPLSTPERLGTENVLRNLVSKQAAEEEAVELLEKSGLSGEESFYKLDERYAKDILFSGLWKLHMKNRS